MIQSVEIKGLRGIREGKLTDFTPLVVLVGPNGCGKSTVIEGIHIAACPTTADAIVQVIRRHEYGGSGPRWLLWRAGLVDSTQIKIASDAEMSRTCQLRLDRGKPESETWIDFEVMQQNGQVRNGNVRAIKNKYHSHNPAAFFPLRDVQEVNLIEAYPASFQTPLHSLYTRAVQFGRRNEAIGIVSEVFPGVTNVEILTENAEPILHFVFADHSVPATLAGDGIQALLRLSLALSASSGGVALLEEPEVHQHPGAIRRSARAILAAVRRGIQVVLTTHSLELIDSLLAESLDDDLKRMSLYRLVLENGLLKSSRLDGHEVSFSRTTIEDDLR